MVQSLHEAIARDLGMRVRTAENREDESINTTASICARSDGGRLALTIVNLGSNAVYLRPGAAPSSTVGIRLSDGGGSMSMNYRDDYSVVGKEWQAVTASGTTTLYVAEELLEAGL